MCDFCNRVIFEKQKCCRPMKYKFLTSVSYSFDMLFEHVTGVADTDFCMCISLLIPVWAVDVCLCYIKSEQYQNPKHTLLHKTHSKVLLVLSHQISTSAGPYYN